MTYNTIPFINVLLTTEGSQCRMGEDLDLSLTQVVWFRWFQGPVSKKAVNIIDHQHQDDDLCVSVPGVVVVDLHHPAAGHTLQVTVALTQVTRGATCRGHGVSMLRGQRTSVSLGLSQLIGQRHPDPQGRQQRHAWKMEGAITCFANFKVCYCFDWINI